MKGILMKPDVLKAKLKVLEEYGEAQTRRVIKPQPVHPNCDVTLDHFDVIGQAVFDNGDIARPRYKVGEIVYIKEAHYLYGYWERFLGKWIFHAIKTDVRYTDNPPDNVLRGFQTTKGWYKRTPLFLHRRFARYFIQITDVRVERVQDITEEDAIAEGAIAHLGQDNPFPRHHFVLLWSSINKPPYDWQSNPYVFVYTFKGIVN